MSIQPVFLFSISRTGSTLIQRVLSAHDGVATAAEPWILLPGLYGLRRRGVDAEYVHPLLATAIEDFCARLPDGRDAYLRAVHDSALQLYEQAAGPDARWFVDKSPPYHFVVEDVMRAFPEGRFVFLWRNPLSVVASILGAWEHVRWHPTLFRSDLFLGLPHLVAAYRAADERACAVRYEDLVGGDETEWSRLTEHLGFPFDPAALTRFADVALAGRMGDPTGTRRYATLEAGTTEKWKAVLANPLRREWCRRYLRFLGDERLATMGYDGAALRGELDALPPSTADLLPDLGRLLLDVVKEPVRVRLRRQGIGGPSPIRALLTAQPLRRTSTRSL